MQGEVLLGLYRNMLRIRMVEEKIAELYPQQKMRCPVHLCIGQEAVAAGVCANLGVQDYVLSGHRSHGHYLAKGGDLNAMLAELHGKASGCSKGIGGSMHLVDLAAGFLGSVPIVGATIPIAVGAALGTAMRGELRVTAVFFGEAATEEGIFHESMNFAALKRLPVVFVCENNFYSVYSPLAVRQPSSREAVHLAKGHGVENHQGDGNDVAEVYRLAKQAVQKARRGGGPSFLEFKTYRWREHCGPNYDNDLGYRAESEFLEWQARCPIARLKQQLLQGRLVSDEGLDEIAVSLKAEIDTAVQFAEQSPLPKAEVLQQSVFAP